MELLFLYLDDYKNLKQKGISLSSEYLFITRVEQQKVVIDISLNKNYITNFFENQRILNTTAIIGQNGTGKSNILEFIRTALPGGMGGFTYECCVAIREIDNRIGEESLYLYITPLLRNKVRINDTTQKFITEFLPERTSQQGFSTHYSVEKLSKATFINYSNIVDLKLPSTMTRIKLESEEEVGSTSSFYNISTMALLAEDQESYTNNPRIKVEKIDAYKSREFGRNVAFLSSSYRSLLDYELPDRLFVTLMDEDEKALRNDSNAFWVFEIVDRYAEELRQDGGDKKPMFFRRFLRAVFFNMVRTDLQFSKEHFSTHYIENAEADSFEDYFRNVLQKLTTLEFEEFYVSQLNEKAEVILKFIDFVYETLIKGLEDHIILQEESVIVLPVNFQGKFPIQDFIDQYIKAKNITDFLIFKWRSLSSGEQSMLTLISRFYYLKERIGDNFKSLIILMDEPDIYFHPEWQRTLLNKILNYIPNIFLNVNIQFIVTANTPYLVSDLPPSNVVLMRKEKNRLSAHNAQTINKSTFASNIHTLLSEDFYVSNFIGEFAKRKIESVIQFINNPEMPTSLNEQSAKKIIDLIGEPIIRNRLMDMYQDKFRPATTDLQVQRDRLLRELNELDQLIEEEQENQQEEGDDSDA